MSPAVTPWTTPHVRQVRVRLHGHDLSARVGGTDGPVLLLVHGLLGSGGSFGPALDLLARTHRVVAPDLMGHGESEKPPGDYSLGAFATQARDLLTVLGADAATVVGHSLGGGVALQFAHQFPALVERLVLVDSGGLGRDVSPALRAVTLPGAEYVLPAVFNRWTRAAGRQVLRPLHRFTPPGTTQVVTGLDTLADADARAAFVHTARAVLDTGGQRVSAADRCTSPRHCRCCSCGAAPTRSSRCATPGSCTRCCRAAAWRCSPGRGTSPRSTTRAGSPPSSATSWRPPPATC